LSPRAYPTAIRRPDAQPGHGWFTLDGPEDTLLQFTTALERIRVKAVPKEQLLMLSGKTGMDFGHPHPRAAAGAFSGFECRQVW
jgi:hypothetical protein